MEEEQISVIVVDDTPIKRRGVCEFVEETPHFSLYAQVGDIDSAIRLIETLNQEQARELHAQHWLVLSDLRLGNGNGVELGRILLDLAPYSASRHLYAGPKLDSCR